MTTPVFEHLDEIGATLGGAPHLLLGLDFDGTLAPIVAHPEDAAMSAETVSILRSLAARSDVTVAIVSGRALADLKSFVDIDVILAGNHGLEISGRGLNFHHAEAEKSRARLHQICEQLCRRLLSTPGAWVEDKGLTASVHFRNSEESARDNAARLVYAAVESGNRDMIIRKGDQVLEIRPRTDWDKGSAMRWIRDQLPDRCAPVCYVGDDETDEDVFSAVKGVTIRVGDSDATAARFFLDGPKQVTEFLRWLFNVRRSAEARPGKEIDSPQPLVNR